MRGMVIVTIPLIFFEQEGSYQTFCRNDLRYPPLLLIYTKKSPAGGRAY